MKFDVNLNSHWLGVTPGGGGIELLSKQVGRSRALEIVLGANDFDADTAAQYGCMCSIFKLIESSFIVLVG